MPTTAACPFGSHALAIAIPATIVTQIAPCLHERWSRSLFSLCSNLSSACVSCHGVCPCRALFPRMVLSMLSPTSHETITTLRSTGLRFCHAWSGSRFALASFLEEGIICPIICHSFLVRRGHSSTCSRYARLEFTTAPPDACSAGSDRPRMW